MAEILLIDDDDALRGFLQTALTERGHQVHCLDKVDAAAMEVLTDGEFELIIVDEYMPPGINGSDFLRILRREGNDIPVILMTGLGTFALVDPMKELGALVVPKPAAGSCELMKDLALAVQEVLKGEAEIGALVGRTVKLALKLGKTAPYLRSLLDGELRVQVAPTLNHDAERIRKFLGETERGELQENSIQLRADFCHLRYHGESGDYDRNLSLGWLQKLLAAPNKLFTVADLRGDPDGRFAADARLGDERETDDTGIKIIRERLEEIKEIVAKTGGSEYLENEEADLSNRLQQAQQAKKFDSPLRDAHRNMAYQIKTLRDRKLVKDMPRLAAHLRAALQLKFPYLGYYPPPGTSAWQF